jgi:thioredoxin
MKIKSALYFLLLSLAFLTGRLYAQKVAHTSELTLEAFEEKIKQSTAPQILDVRSAQEFSENHLVGAINLNASDTALYNKRIQSLDKHKPVFVYSINNGRSSAIAKQLRSRGFTEVYELPGGIAHWIGAGKPIESKAGQGISAEEFHKLVTASNLVLVDVGSKHCGACKKLAPVVDTVAHHYAGKLNVHKIELYDNRALAKQLNIASVPTLILYKDGKPVWTKSGNVTKEILEEVLQGYSTTPSCEGTTELMKRRTEQAMKN